MSLSLWSQPLFQQWEVYLGEGWGLGEAGEGGVLLGRAAVRESQAGASGPCVCSVAGSVYIAHYI